MSYLVNGDSQYRLLLAHGAGAPMDSDFMNGLAQAMADAGIQVIRFEFPYMQRRRETGRRSPPNREPILLEAWHEAISDVVEGHVPGVASGKRVFIGGKSLGGRMASLIAARPEAHDMGVAGCLCFGYPFHAPAKPDKWRTTHFAQLNCPLWIAQGERDPFGHFQQALDRLKGQANLALVAVADGDHDFKPRKSSGLEQAHNLKSVAEQASAFIVNRHNDL